MNNRKMNIGGWITLIAVVVTIVAFILYTVNVRGAGYFQDAGVKNMYLFGAAAVAGLLLALVIGSRAAGKAADLCAGILQIVGPVAIAFCLINLVAARVEGLAFIYFSNADVANEVQTAENLSSGRGAIVSMAAFGVALCIAVIAAFFSLRKKEA